VLASWVTKIGLPNLEKNIKERKEKVRKLLREITVKIRLARVDIQERITIEALLDSKATKLVVSTEFVKKNMGLSWRDLKNQFMWEIWI